MSAVRWTLGASLAYNIVDAGLMVAGLIHPMTAEIMMPLSPLTVLAIAVRYPALTPIPELSAPVHGTRESPTSGVITGSVARPFCTLWCLLPCA